MPNTNRHKPFKPIARLTSRGMVPYGEGEYEAEVAQRQADQAAHLTPQGYKANLSELDRIRATQDRIRGIGGELKGQAGLMNMGNWGQLTQTGSALIQQYKDLEERARYLSGLRSPGGTAGVATTPPTGQASDIVMKTLMNQLGQGTPSQSPAAAAGLVGPAKATIRPGAGGSGSGTNPVTDVALSNMVNQVNNEGFGPQFPRGIPQEPANPFAGEGQMASAPGKSTAAPNMPSLPPGAQVPPAVAAPQATPTTPNMAGHLAGVSNITGNPQMEDALRLSMEGAPMYGPGMENPVAALGHQARFDEANLPVAPEGQQPGALDQLYNMMSNGGAHALGGGLGGYYLAQALGLPSWLGAGAGGLLGYLGRDGINNLLSGLAGGSQPA